MGQFILPVIKGRTFQNTTVFMDGNRYENCKFLKCRLSYSGGPGEASGCYFGPDTEWLFSDHAATVVETLQRYGFRLVFGNEPQEEPIRFPSDAL